jgi:hypothetical protein
LSNSSITLILTQLTPANCEKNPNSAGYRRKADPLTRSLDFLGARFFHCGTVCPVRGLSAELSSPFVCMLTD